jgi:class 3 adenylate cyclase
MKTKLALCSIALILASCGGAPSDPVTLDVMGEQFVKLGLELGEYDSGYIDSYVGPDEWQQAAKENLRPKEELAAEITALFADVQAFTPTDDEDGLRHKAMLGRVRAMDTRMRMLNGETFSFAEEARLLYDVELPTYDFAEFDQVLEEIEELVPGDGDLAERVDALQASVAIPEDKLDVVFNRAIEECRRRTLEYISLPGDERFRLEYVSGVSWSGYLEYLGDHESLMSINLDTPLNTNRAVDLGCHEGYPGHHVYNLLVDQRYLQEKGWNEFQLAPLYTPAMLIHEGSAEYGVSLAFPGEESWEFERDVLVPLAGVDPEKAATLDKLLRLKSRIGDPAMAATAQLYLDGRISREEAIEQRRKYSLSSRTRAERNVRFIEEGRSYVLNYGIGEDLVSAYIEKDADDHASRWQAFKRLIEELPSASDMVD